MYTLHDQEYIRVLVADDDENVLACYREVFSDDDETGQMQALNEMAADLFDTETDIINQPKFDVVACNQGPLAAQLVAVECHQQLALFQALGDVLDGDERTLVPNDHGAGPVVALGDDPLEVGVFDGMVLGLHGEPLDRRVE